MGQATHLIVGANDLVTNFDFAFFHLTNVQHVSIVDLHIANFELGFTVNCKHASIVFLPSLLCVKVGLVEEDTKGSVGWEFAGRCVEFG